MAASMQKCIEALANATENVIGYNTDSANETVDFPDNKCFNYRISNFLKIK